MKLTVLLFFSLLLPVMLCAQKTEHGLTFRDMSNTNYVRFYYDNDYFVTQDQNYTQGFNFERVAPFFKKSPINHLFPKPMEKATKYGVSLEHLMYTPENIGIPEIQPEARPFSALIMFNSFMIATDTIKYSRVTSSLSIGFIGPGAFGEEMQVSFHKLTNNLVPEGWQNQIQNDLILNYDIQYEKQLYRLNNLFSLHGIGAARVGTLFTDISTGVNMTFGIINAPLKDVSKEKKFQIYLYSELRTNASIYDATLQGGLFNGKNRHTLSSGQLQPFTAEFNYGAVMQTKHIYAEFTRSQITRQIEKGTPLKWGGIRVGVRW